MKISYDKVTQEYHFPLSRHDIGRIHDLIPRSLIEKIASVRFGCNAKTTQEGRMVQRGARYQVRINFCLNDGCSPILSSATPYRKTIERFGGTFLSEKTLWEPEGARLYAYFLLLHEIAHIAYCEEFHGGRLEGHGSPKEESWCDQYANRILASL